MLSYQLFVHTARTGIAVGMSGIGTGLVATLAYMHPENASVYAQLGVLGAGGGGLGYYLSTKVLYTIVLLCLSVLS